MCILYCLRDLKDVKLIVKVARGVNSGYNQGVALLLGGSQIKTLCNRTYSPCSICQIIQKDRGTKSLKRRAEDPRPYVHLGP